MKKKILITGGHVTPALALIDELVKFSDVEPVFVGRSYAVEKQLVTEKKIRFIPITAGKSSWSAFVKIPVGFVQAFQIVLRERPRIIVSFGGYVALPVAVCGWILGIPVVTHEQTLEPGLANRMIANIAKRVCVTFPETAGRFPKEKVVVTGLPMRKELFAKEKTAPFTGDYKNYPLLYITGGSQGAKSLNDALFPLVTELTNSYTVIHQTGMQSTGAAQQVQNSRYIHEPFIPESKLAWILKNAKIVIGRSGANTTMELAALGRVALLVPLPWSAGNEQLLQAEWLARHGGAVVLEQASLTPELFFTTLKELNISYLKYSARAEEFSRTIPRDGAATLARAVYSLCR